MTASLDQWQERLHNHFAQLATLRSYSDFPLFALEHGLTESEFSEITDLLHAELAELKEAWRLARHWLLWVVYATEMGYDYDGGDFWPSFEQRTPHWREPITSTRRNQLRTWFSRFQSTYHGVKPSGEWAEHFSIIAWPITHAILPQYLQSQFARSLHELRYQLAHFETLSPKAVGELLAANAWDASSRFQEFLQQQELAGRIVLALLSDRTVEGQSPVYPQTLERLVSDLERVQSTREWLKETRSLVADRLQGSGRTSPGALTRRDAGDGGAGPTGFCVRPRLMLRPSNASTWSIAIDIPSFGSAARSSPELHKSLRSTRCKIAGTDIWHPSDWLLSGARQQVLKTWPGAGSELLQFERSDQVLDRFASSETRLQAGPFWLCRIGSDGLAREVTGRMVRPGRKYVLLSETAFASRSDLLASCSVKCGGVHAALLAMPQTLSSETMARLQQLGLQVARTVRIWPTGLSARGFDGEGQSEWLTTEAPCFGIIHDHPVDTYVLRLDGESETLIDVRGPNSPVFVRIAPLPAGRHTLIVKARRTPMDGVLAPPVAEGIITLDVREPEPWIPGTTSHAGLAISLEPDNPSLDAFWEGDVGVNVLGPAGHQISCAISLYNASGLELLAEPIATFDLPVAPAEWFNKFSRFVEDKPRAWTFLEAASGKFLIRGDELGEYALRLERDVKPVRWVFRNLGKTTTVRLIDDTGGDDMPTCCFFSFRNPALPITLNAETVLAGLEVEAPGGIFDARHGKFRDAVNLSIPPNGHGFADLLIEPDLHGIDTETIPVTGILETLKLWSETRMLGPLVAMRRNRIIDRLANKLYTRLCSQHWAEAEATFLAPPHPGFARQKLQDSVGGPHAFSSVLSRESDRMDAGTDTGKCWFASVASRYQVSSDQGLCEFALQLASHPSNLLAMVPIPSVLDGFLTEVKQKSVLLRAARLVALLSANRNPGPFGSVFPRWKW